MSALTIVLGLATLAVLTLTGHLSGSSTARSANLTASSSSVPLGLLLWVGCGAAALAAGTFAATRGTSLAAPERAGSGIAAPEQDPTTARVVQSS